MDEVLRDILVTLGYDVDRPWRELPKRDRDWILFTDEQPVVERPAEGRLDRRPALGGDPEGLVEDLHPVAAPLLGPVEGGVGGGTSSRNDARRTTSSVRTLTVVVKFNPDKTVKDCQTRASYF